MSCPSCKSELVFPEGYDGEAVCSRCGLVVNHQGNGHKFVEFNAKMPSNWGSEDSETLREWLTTLRTVSCQLSLPNYPYNEEAARVIRQKSHVLFRSQRFGKNKREAVTALMYLILREYEVMRPIKEICETLALDPSMVRKYSWEMRRTTDLGKRFTASDYLKKYGIGLVKDLDVLVSAEHVLAALKRRMSGHPAALAAGAFFFVCKSHHLRISKDKVGQAFHISGRTVYTNAHRISKLLANAYLPSAPRAK